MKYQKALGDPATKSGVIGGEQIHELEFFYILIPVFSGALILFLIAFIVNNIPKNRAYPESFKHYLKKKYQRYKRRRLKRSKR